MQISRTILRKCICGLIVFNTLFSYGQSIAPEYQLKAVFLFNFTQFVEWPATAFATEDAPLIIGILGEDPFGSFLNEAIAGEKINGHPLQIKHYNSFAEIQACHILFITEKEIGKLQLNVGKLNKNNILTVSDASNFLKEGGMIRFYTIKNRIQLQINLDAAKEADLVISSKLLRLAEIFTPAKK